ncbi:MAG: trypsin-like peptidase domain-containing protein [Acidobacteriota bacterium]|nr:trypsin-like peptidase domain-containing protein [Acidobacteriota bacterium]
MQTSASVPGTSGGSSATVPSTGGSSSTSPFGGSSGGSGTSGSSGSSGTADAAAIAAKVDPALVDINVTFGSSGAGAGTGIVLSSNGEILTNNHVVEGATTISVVDLGNGRTYSASVVGYDRSEDVAVIQLANASGLQTATIGDSSKVSVGDAVVGIGNAGGTGGTPSVAAGSVTALNQSITASDQATGTSENLTGLIETNANIQPGDSGGSLVNASGQVIGMDTAAAQGYSFSYQGSQVSQGYAIPINKAVSIASQIEAGRATSSIHVGPTAYLGVYISSGSSQGGFSGLGGQNAGGASSGAYVSGVVTGGPAAQAGLGQGDVITSVNGTAITSAADLTNAVAHYKPGQSVQVGWTDSSGASHSSTLVLGTGPAQ